MSKTKKPELTVDQIQKAVNKLKTATNYLKHPYQLYMKAHPYHMKAAIEAERKGLIKLVPICKEMEEIQEGLYAKKVKNENKNKRQNTRGTM